MLGQPNRWTPEDIAKMRYRHEHGEKQASIALSFRCSQAAISKALARDKSKKKKIHEAHA